MGRYIDAEKFKHSLELSIKSWSRDCNSKASTIKTTYQEVLHRLETMPTADVVEVVRCKECKHCELRYPVKAIGEEPIEGYYCYPNQRYVKSTDFCNYGERRDT